MKGFCFPLFLVDLGPGHFYCQMSATRNRKIRKKKSLIFTLNELIVIDSLRPMYKHMYE